MTTLSVLICTYNRHALLARALAALIERTVEKPDQVVVVNGGDDRADRVVEKYLQGSGVHVELVRTQNVNLAASRSLGLPCCRGEIIAMTDDDAEVAPDWVTLMKRVHAEHPEAGAVGGRVIGDDSGSMVGRLADVATFGTPEEAQYVRTLPGVNISYKKAVVDMVGLQDASLFRGEDVDYNWRVKETGYQVFFDPRIAVLHHHRRSLAGFFLQHWMYGRAYVRVRRKWPQMYCVYPHRIAGPWDCLKIVNFVAATFYEPLVTSQGLRVWRDKILGLPILIANQCAWRGGMLYQMMQDGGRHGLGSLPRRERAGTRHE